MHDIDAGRDMTGDVEVGTLAVLRAVWIPDDGPSGKLFRDGQPPAW